MMAFCALALKLIMLFVGLIWSCINPDGFLNKTVEVLNERCLD